MFTIITLLIINSLRLIKKINKLTQHNINEENHGLKHNLSDFIPETPIYTLIIMTVQAAIIAVIAMEIVAHVILAIITIAVRSVVILFLAVMAVQDFIVDVANFSLVVEIFNA